MHKIIMYPPKNVITKLSHEEKFNGPNIEIENKSIDQIDITVIIGKNPCGNFDWSLVFLDKVLVKIQEKIATIKNDGAIAFLRNVDPRKEKTLGKLKKDQKKSGSITIPKFEAGERRKSYLFTEIR